MGNQLPLTNVINVSVSEAQTGVGEYNVNNLALFTNDTPGSSFGLLGYSIYLSPQQVGSDFGTNSETFALANQIFSQQPNILAGGGYLTIIPYLPATETLTLSSMPVSGSFTLLYGSQSVIVGFNETAGSLQAALRAVPGLGQVQVANSVNSGSPVQVTFYGVYDPALFTIGSNTMLNGGGSAVTVTPAFSGSYESIGAAVARTESLVQYFGVLPGHNADTLGSADVMAAAAVIQPLNKLIFVSSNSPADIQPNGLLDFVRQSGFTQTRCLYYGDTDANCLNFAAGYASRGLSTNFEGTNTTQTMHLKNLIGVAPDPTITQTLLNQAVAAGADTYPSLQGVAKVFTSGANQFYDNVYNLQWFVGALQVAGFNYLAESDTKIPQTEQGMTGLKGAYRVVAKQAVTNGYLAPGAWTSSTTFGNQADFLSNIAGIGYYIFSQPVSQQNPTARAARQAPLVQIAAKEAGAVQSSDVIVFINA